MNRKIAMSLISAGTMLTLVVGATFAFFSNSSTSVNNTFASGTLDLLVDDNNESATESVTGSIIASNFAPGESVTGFISLHNPGSLPIAEVEMTADTTETNDGGAPSDMRGVLNLTVVRDDAVSDPACVDGDNYTSTIDIAVGDGVGPLTLAEFDNGGTDVFDAFPALAVSETRNICLTVTFESLAGNEYQGDAVDTTFTFTGNQDVSQ